MLTPLHAAVDLAADRRRELLAEADAYRLTRTARAAHHAQRPHQRRATGLGRLRLLTPGRRATT